MGKDQEAREMYAGLKRVVDILVQQSEIVGNSMEQTDKKFNIISKQIDLLVKMTEALEAKIVALENNKS